MLVLLHAAHGVKCMQLLKILFNTLQLYTHEEGAHIGRNCSYMSFTIETSGYMLQEWIGGSDAGSSIFHESEP